VNVALTVLEIVAPVFLLAGVGFAWVRLGYDYDVAFVTRLAMTLSVPCLIFVALMRLDVPAAAVTALSGAALVAYGALALAFWIVLRIARLDLRTYLAPLIFGNTGNLGLPLALFAFGETGLGYAVVVFAIMAILSFTFGLWLVAGGGSPLRALREPMVGATFAGGVFMWNGWQTPTWLTNTLDLAGQMAIPLMLITLGVAVARLHPSGLARALVLSVMKVVVAASLGWAIATAFALDDVAAAVLTLQVATPVAVTSYLLAQKYADEAEAVAGLVVASTLVSVAALPVLLGLLV